MNDIILAYNGVNVIYTCGYIPSLDITVVFKDVYIKDDIKTRTVSGFVYGELDPYNPNERAMLLEHLEHQTAVFNV